jgi:ribosomal-protein-serine acetyltransferase
MVIKFKNQLKGDRLVLERTKPSIQMAEAMFAQVDRNRKHLEKWLPWTEFTNKVEDSLKYLFDKEESTKLGKKVEYGIYLKNIYIENIGIFDISEDDKSAEIGYWLSADYGKNGYMSEAVRIIEKEFFINHNLNRLQIKCDEENTASSRVAKKCNFKLEGLLREDKYSKYFNKLKNTLVFSKLKSEYEKK